MRLLSSKLLPRPWRDECIVSKKWSARPESIMNLGPSPLLSRVHVLKLKRKVGKYYSGLLAGFQPATLRTEQKTIGMAQREAAAVAIAIAFLGTRVALPGGMEIRTAYKMEIDLSSGRSVGAAAIKAFVIAGEKAIVKVGKFGIGA
jgi:hypothetical protein